MARERFIEAMTPALVRFGSDLAAVLRIVEDPEIDDESRTAVAGALLHILSSSNAIPGVRGVLRHLGEVLVLRLVFAQVRERSPDAFARHAAASPELFEGLDEELASAKAFLEERFRVIEEVAGKVDKTNHQGQTPGACVHDTESSNWLYDAVQEARIEQFDFEEEDVVRELKGVEQILGPLESKIKR